MVYVLCVNPYGFPEPTVSITCYGVQAYSGYDPEDYDWSSVVQVVVMGAGQYLGQLLCPNHEGDTLTAKQVVRVNCSAYTLRGTWPDLEVYRTPCGNSTVCTYYFDNICDENGNPTNVTLVNITGRNSPCKGICEPDCGW